MVKKRNAPQKRLFVVFGEHSFCFEGFNKRQEFVIPFLSESADKRIFQEFVDGKFEFSPELDSGFANRPSMIVEGDISIGEGLFANGIEVATDGFCPVYSAFSVCAVGGAETDAVFVVAGETAVFAIDDACD